MFEVDYPHGDSTWPNTVDAVEQLVKETGLSDDELVGLLRNNAIACYRLERFGLTPA